MMQAILKKQFRFIKVIDFFIEYELLFVNFLIHLVISMMDRMKGKIYIYCYYIYSTSIVE